ncbi:hypothetical protein DFA_12267 [Cavenderia fasciculata]|uniref:Uncharacterized protein n=1 Tax=Cavenderia fasciculata TaxID=261658 RepID=F4QCW8_CACFS|nr:uncharacterized protein DFA_12267 [Cavenderia fasciculata]EGG14492.1 hypothetical protein DFA_12267 [Cavenderia fasciculata]|eukprot:XP_004353901.1 hypothetical protein DFA_12267 [Cavenderia fasciculata]
MLSFLVFSPHRPLPLVYDIGFIQTFNINIICLGHVNIKIISIYYHGGRKLKDLKKVLKIGRMNGWTFTSPDSNDLKFVLDKFSQPGINNNNNQMRRHLIINATHQQNERTVKIIHLQPIEPKEKQDDGMYSGCCCECCGDCDFKPFTWVCEKLFGKFPNLSTGIQFFNKKMYNAYKQEGINAFNEINQNNIIIINN